MLGIFAKWRTSTSGSEIPAVLLDHPRITIHSLTQQTFDAGSIHTAKDKFSAMRLDDYYQTYRLLSAYLAYLDLFLNGPDVKSPQ
jgi:hypothetical protein